MLDFYYIKDQMPDQEDPGTNDLQLAGSLDLFTFNDLWKKELIEKEYTYFEDFRWKSDYVKLKLKNLVREYHELGKFFGQEKIKRNPTVGKLIVLLEKAQEAKTGLIAYCD